MENHIENIEGNKSKGKRLCSFYASDYHFEMISLPYIVQELKNKKQVVILTENNLCNTVQKVLNRINLCEEDKKEIFEIDWDQDNQNKLDKIKTETSKNQSMTVFIKGGKNYVQKMDSYIQENIHPTNMKIIYSYPVEEVKEEMPNLVSKYQGILKTTKII